MSRSEIIHSMIIISQEDFQLSNCIEQQTFKNKESMIIIETDFSGSMAETVMRIGEAKGKTVVLAIIDLKEGIILNATTETHNGKVGKKTIKIDAFDIDHYCLMWLLFLIHILMILNHT